MITDITVEKEYLLNKAADLVFKVCHLGLSISRIKQILIEKNYTIDDLLHLIKRLELS